MDPIGVLLVDDNLPMREALGLVFRGDARQPPIEIIAEAETGVDGLRMFIEHRPDLVLTNISMPEMNGLEMARRITADDPAARILFETAVESERSLVPAVELGARGLLLKPLDVNQLKRVVREVALDAKPRDFFYFDGWEPRSTWTDQTA